MNRRLIWERDGMDWPHRDVSRFVQAAGLRWHIQEFGLDTAREIRQKSGRENDPASGSPTSGKPTAVLLHGTGASTHSWRGLAPLLAPHCHVLAMDLPGHGFTSMPADGHRSPQLSLTGMAQALGALLQHLRLKPAVVVGHSAGAAVAVRMCLDGLIAPQRVVSINGALLPLGGLAGQVFSPVARLMAAAPFVPRLFSWRAGSPAVLQALIRGTGSRLDAEGMALYGQLVTNPGHAAGALGMMANWDLPGLQHELPKLATPLRLVVGECDRTIPPRQAERVLAMLPPALRRPVTTLGGLGHLAHEEQPGLLAPLVLANEH